MTYVTQENITAQILEVFERTPDPRLREVMQSLVKHLHAFVREVEPSDAEFEKGCEFLVGLGKNTSENTGKSIGSLGSSRSPLHSTAPCCTSLRNSPLLMCVHGLSVDIGIAGRRLCKNCKAVISAFPCFQVLCCTR